MLLGRASATFPFELRIRSSRLLDISRSVDQRLGRDYDSLVGLYILCYTFIPFFGHE